MELKVTDDGDIEDILSFQEFVTILFYSIEKRPFIWHPMAVKISELLTAYIGGVNTKQNLNINVPPRSGKSLMFSYFIAYCITYMPASMFIYTSYNQNLSNEKGIKDVYRILDSETYKLLYGDIKYTEKRSDYFKTKEGGCVKAVSAGLGITGFGAGRSIDKSIPVEDLIFEGCILIDDPIKPQELGSSVAREKVKQYYTRVLKSRRNNSINVPFILIMQRLHPDDLVTYILETEGDLWESYVQPALVEGQSILPDTYSTDYLLRLRDVDPFAFYAQYQQQPIIDGGEVIRSEWINEWISLNGKQFKAIYITVDSALSTKTSSDYSVILVVGITTEGDIYILDMIRGKFEFPELLRRLQKVYIDSRAKTVFIENKASGQPLIDMLKQVRVPVQPLNPTKDKYTRLMEEIDIIACGYVHVPQQALWKHEFIDELVCYRKDNSHQHDDIVDALVYAVKVSRRYHRWSI